MSFLPGSLTPAFRSPWCAHIVASLRRRTYPIRTVIQLLDVGKTKRADYTEHQKSAGAWLSLQSDVLCNRLWKFKVGFCFLQLPPTEPKAWWSGSALPVYRYRVGRNRLMVEHWYSVVPPLYRYITYSSRFWMSLTVFGISKSSFQRDQKKIPLLVRTFRSDLSTGFGKQFSYTSRKNIHIRTLHRRISFQVVAGENGILSIVVLKW